MFRPRLRGCVVAFVFAFGHTIITCRWIVCGSLTPSAFRAGRKASSCSAVLLAPSTNGNYSVTLWRSRRPSTKNSQSSVRLSFGEFFAPSFVPPLRGIAALRCACDNVAPQWWWWLLLGRFLKLRWISHFGSESSCTLTHLMVLGTPPNGLSTDDLLNHFEQSQQQVRHRF